MFFGLREQLAAKQFGDIIIDIRLGITPYQGGKYDRSKQSYKKIW